MPSTMRRKVRKMPRRATDQYAVLAVQPAKLVERMKKEKVSVRELARFCGHASHSHIYRMMTGQTKTTSLQTAKDMERILDAEGLLFARMAVRSLDRTAA